MQLRDIQYVITVANELSFTKAARSLFISQPALSQNIKRLEEELNVSLFIRKNNSICLTDAGKLFVAEGEEILRRSEILKTKMSDIANLCDYRLRIGISTFYSNVYFPQILSAFRKQYPTIQLEIVEESSEALEKLVCDDKIDFCMVPSPLQNSMLETRALYQEQILLAVPPNHPLNRQFTPPELSERPFIDLKIVAEEPFVFLKKQQRFTSMGMKLCEDAGFIPHIVFETSNWNTVNSLVANGMGIGFVPEILSRMSLFESKPSYYRILGSNTSRTYMIACKEWNKLPLIALNFISIAQKSLLTEVGTLSADHPKQ